jgi:hypothetical protein
LRDFNGEIHNCFSPRHGLRVTWHDHIYDFVICYECKSMLIYVDGRSVAGLALTGSAKTFDEILRAAHVELAKE